MQLSTAKILIIGYGSIGQGITPLLISKLGIDTNRITAIAADTLGQRAANELGITFIVERVTPQNYHSMLSSHLTIGDLLLNLSVGVSSVDLISWCQSNDVFYLDTCVEPWDGGYRTENPEHSTNAYLRQQAMSLRSESKATAVIAHGANPGLITHFAKRGLTELAKLKGVRSWEGWGDLSMQLGVKVIQVAERDTQLAATHNGDTFGNTWSCTGFKSELYQKAEIGLGSHETSDFVYPHAFSDLVSCPLSNSGIDTRVKTWLPVNGETTAYLVTHHEAISLAALLTVPDTNGVPIYRPTVYYAYDPCPAAEYALNSWRLNHKILPMNNEPLRDTLISGADQLGALFIFDGGAYWYGSTLDLESAREMAPYNNATSLQVVAGILGAIHWIVKNPRAGVVEPEQMDYLDVLKVASPMLGSIDGVLTDWQVSKTHILDDYLVS